MFGWRSGKESVDLELEGEMLHSTDKLDTLAKEGSNIESAIEKSELDISELQNHMVNLDSELSDVNSEIEELNRQMLLVQSNKSKLESEHKTCSKKHNELQSELSRLNLDVDNLAKEYSNVGHQLNKLRENWNEELKSFKPNRGTITNWKKFGSSKSPSKLIAVGDIHGWAPGLINLIHSKTNFEVELLGHKLDPSMLSRRFPNPLEAKRSGRHLPRVGLNGHPLRENTEPTPYDGLLIRGEDDDNLLVQVGDLIDRGDHNEVVLELMRQIMIISPGSSLSLIGNHEAWIIEGDYSNWKTNEDRFRMHGRPRPGTTVHDPLMTGANDLEKSMETSFKILEGAVGALLLTQYFSLIEGMSDAGGKAFSKRFEDSFNCLPMSKDSLRKSVLNGGWELHDIGRTVLNTWRYESKDKELFIPGAFSLISIGENVFCHAEANGLSHPQSDINNISEKFDWCGHKIQILCTRMSNSTILDLPLLHARSKGDTEKTVEGLEKLKQIIPEFENYIHGHTPHNGEPISNHLVDGSLANVVNCDIGMTPIYRALRHENPYDTSVIPFCFESQLQKGVDCDE